MTTSKHQSNGKVMPNNEDFENSKAYIEEGIKGNPLFAEAYNLKGSLADDVNDLETLEILLKKQNY